MADIVTNHKARRDYHILETFEAGIVLHGTEVKSLRAGKGQIGDAFARVDKEEVWLYNAHIDEYSHGNLQNHQPKARANCSCTGRRSRNCSAWPRSRAMRSCRWRSTGRTGK